MTLTQLQKQMNDHFKINNDFEYLHIVNCGNSVEYVNRDERDFTSLITDIIEFLKNRNHQFKLVFKGRRGFTLTRINTNKGPTA